MTRKELKEKAKQSLKENYGKIIGAYLIYLVLSTIATAGFSLLINQNNIILTLLYELISVIIPGILFFGLQSLYLKVSKNEEVSVKEIFSKTNLFWAYICISFLIGLFTILWTFLLIIPGIIAALSYSLVFLIKLDNPELSALECISKSKQMMNGHKLDYFILQLSFIGWSLLLVVILLILMSIHPILAIIVIFPLIALLTGYMTITNCNFYNYLKNKSIQTESI